MRVDRETQRAIRERTKRTIENLERQIEGLTSQQPYQELQAVVRAKELVEQELAQVKQKLSNLVGVLQNIIGSDGSSDNSGHVFGSASSSHHLQGGATHGGSSMPNTSSAAASAASPSGSIDPRMGSATDIARLQLTNQKHNLQTSLDLGPERLGLGFLLDSSQNIMKLQNGLNGAQDTPQFQHVPMKHDWTAVANEHAFRPRPPSNSWGPNSWVDSGRQEDDSASTSTNTGHSHHGYSPHSQNSPASHQHHQQSQPQAQSLGTPYFSTPVKNCSPTCPLDSLLLDFMAERRQRAFEGLSAQEVVGPRYPSVSSLLNPANSHYSHPLSKVFTDILSTFPDLSSLPERVAVLYIMFLVMRWSISPTKENYDRLPEWVRPLPSQQNIPHPAWMDNCPFPRMREKMARDYHKGEYVFENFFIPYTTTLTLSWPYEETDTLLQIPESDELLINPVFERHLRNLDNWKLGEAFIKAFPSLKDTCNIGDRNHVAGGSRRL